jgi:AcrR family transcriptional regulator
MKKTQRLNHRTPRRARTKEDKAKRKRVLLDAAQELFTTRGYQGTTIEMITERANVSIGTFYLYFSGKSEIYKVFQDKGIDILTDMIRETVEAPSPSYRDTLVAITRTYFRFWSEYREYFDFIALISLGGQDELREQESAIGQRIDDKTRSLLSLIEGVIRRGIEAGEFRPLKSWEVTSILWGLMDGLILLCERDNIRVIGVDLTELIESALDTLFFGMVTPEEQGGSAEGEGVTIPAAPPTKKVE